MNDPRFPLRTPAPSGPPVLWVLLGLMAGAHVLRMLFTLPSDVPAGALSMESLLRGEWWSVLTYPFTHRDVLHLVTNLALLALFGHAVERQAGGRHLLYIFIAGAWAGAGLHLMLWPDAPPVIGASGGAYAVIGAFGALFPEYDLLRPLRGILPGRLKAKRLFPALLAVHVGLELLRRFAAADAPGWIGEQAHLVHAGGLLAGWLYGRYLAAEDVSGAEAWNDFFPQGLRRRYRDRDSGVPVAAGLPPRRQEESEFPVLPAPPRELSDTEFLSERVDPILEKLYDKGADQLTADERAVLEEASRRFSRDRR